jgi:hypothetical protein
MQTRALRRAITAVLAGWLAALLLAAPGAAAGVRLEAAAGFDGLGRAGAWLPVRVTLTNDGADTAAVVRVQRRTGDGDLQTTSQAVELPAGARKQVTLLVLADGVLGPLTVQALAGDQVLAEAQVEARTTSGRLVGVLAGTPEAAARVVAGLGTRGGVGQAARLTPGDLPANPYALAALDALVVNGVSSRLLTPAQVAALGEWVAGGGTLVLGGGASAPAVLEGLGELAPVRLSGAATSLPRLPALEALTATPVEAAGPFVVASAAPAPEAAVLAAQADRPLVVARPLGLGRVAFVALDLGLDPFLGWTGATRFWDALLPAPAQPPFERGGGALLDAGMRLRWALGSGTALDLPAVGTLALALLGYVLAIGPLNYLLLRRLDRREWAWLTTPALTLLFTGALFGLGAGTRGGQLSVNTLSIVHSTAGAPGAAVESHIGIFSPGRATYTLRLPAETLVTSLPDFTRGPSTPLPGSQLWQGGASEVRDIPFAAAEFKTFAAQGGIAAAPIETDLRVEGDQVVGTVRNAGDQPLRDVHLLVGDYLQALGTLAPGATAPVAWRLPAEPPAAPDDLPLAARLSGGRFPGGGPGQDWREQARFQLLEVAFEREADRGLTGVQVLAWHEAAPLPPVIAGAEARQQALTLVRHTAAVRVQPGPVRLPPGLLPRAVASGAGQPPGRFPPGLLAAGPGETIVDFLLPAGLAGLATEELDLLIGQWSGGPGIGLPPAAAPGQVAGATAAPPAPRPNAPVPPRPVVAPGAVQFALYDYQAGAWMPLPHAGAGRVVVPDAARYVSPAGPVRLRITVAGASEPLVFSRLELGLRGRLP